MLSISKVANASPILERKIEETTAGLPSSFAKHLCFTGEDNAATIVEYIAAVKNEVNLSDKIGRLFLNNGNWNGKQIISEKWVNESTRPDTSTDPAPFYQYMWRVDPLSADSTRYNFYAAGNYGQFIYVIPKKNIIIVRHGYKSEYDNWTELFKQLGLKI